MNGAELARLVADAPLLADGGVGTALIDHGLIQVDGCFEALNLHAPEGVAEVHGAFARAGARLIETNTFGANRYALSAHGLADRVVEINRAGVELAKRAGRLVAGSVGPLRVRLAPYGRVRRQDARAAYTEQIRALADAGADLILIETQSDLNEMQEALRAARDVCDLAVVVQATYTRDDRTLLGSTPEQVARTLAALEVDGIGVNCSEGPAQVARILEAIRPHAGAIPLSAMPNAGGPTRLAERIVYPATPEYAAEYARAFVAAGARIIGGCCGMRPDHIEAMAEALNTPRQLHLDVLPSAPVETGPVVAAEPTTLGSKLDEGRFVVSVEIDPPRSVSTARILVGAETLAASGADAINIADSPMAKMRMSPWAPARLIQERVGIDTILHFPTRGRNLLRIQGDLLAAHALGIRNLFVCLGDPARIGDYPAATDNVDVVPTGLLDLVTTSLNRGEDGAGASIGEPTSFVAGCAVNLAPDDMDRECRLLKRKIDAGATFALSQPVYRPEVVASFAEAYADRHGELTLPILVGVLPLVTSRHAEFLHNELPGISIPDGVRDRMRAAGGDGARTGLAIAAETIAAFRDHAAGLYVMPPFGRFDLAAELVEAVRDRQTLG